MRPARSLPSPPEIVVDPVLRPTAAAIELARASSSSGPSSRAPRRRSSRCAAAPHSVTPARPGRAIDRDALHRRAPPGAPRRQRPVEAPLAASRPELDTAAAEEAAADRAPARRARPSQLTYDGEAVGLARAGATRAAAPLRSARRPLRRHASTASGSPPRSGRPPSVAHARHERALPRRRRSASGSPRRSPGST